MTVVIALAFISMKNWRKYAFEFFSIFVAVVSAFALNNWNNNRLEAYSEQKILQEIANGIELDISDLKNNQLGHRMSIRAIDKFKQLLRGDSLNQDTIARDYILLFRGHVYHP